MGNEFINDLSAKKSWEELTESEQEDFVKWNSQYNSCITIASKSDGQSFVSEESTDYKVLYAMRSYLFEKTKLN